MKMTYSRSKGFTLAEVLIVALIVGLLSSVAYPSYVNNVRKANRSEAISELQRLMSAQERYFLSNKEYADDLQKLGLSGSTVSIDDYDIEANGCASPNDNVRLCVELRAAASTESQKKDGDIVMNTIGRSELVKAGTNTLIKQL